MRRFVALFLVAGCVPVAPDDAEKVRRNLSQTGVHDVQIELKVRQDYAREKGLPVPQR